MYVHLIEGARLYVELPREGMKSKIPRDLWSILTVCQAHHSSRRVGVSQHSRSAYSSSGEIVRG